MIKKFLLALLLLSGLSAVSASAAGAYTGAVSVIVNCSGTQVVRVEAGRFEVRYIEPNTPGCRGGSPLTSYISGSTSSGGVSTGSTITMTEIVNCSGLKITSLSDGSYASTHVAPNLPGCIDTTHVEGEVEIEDIVTEDVETGSLEVPEIDLSHGPLFDITSADMMAYRAKLLKDRGVRFANALRSLRMRRAASMEARTNAYLLRGDAVVIEGKETGWVKVQGASLEVTDLQENTVEANTEGKASGYSASAYLRDPNTSDLVRIEQADHAYWSDIARVNVAHMVNVRSHPWYTSSIVTTLKNGTPLYVIATVDNWSEVRNDEGNIRGYIRSDFLTIEKAQRVDNPNTNDVTSEEDEEVSVSDGSWIAE